MDKNRDMRTMHIITCMDFCVYGVHMVVVVFSR